MSNLIQWAIAFHNQIRNEHTSLLVKITHIGGTLIVPATIVDPNSYINVEGVRKKSEHYLCMMNQADVERVRFNRSTKIEEINPDTQAVLATYEVVIDKVRQDEFDDPIRNTINVPIKLVSHAPN